MIPGTCDAFAGSNRPDEADVSPAGRLDLIRSNVRARGHATPEEVEWLIAQGTFPTHAQIARAEKEKRARDFLDSLEIP